MISLNPSEGVWEGEGCAPARFAVTAPPVLRTEPQARLGPDGRVPTGASLATTYWAIRRKSDGALMPSSRRPSYAEFDDGGPPRLFRTKAAAHSCLRNWCMGYWHLTMEWESTDEYGSGFYVQDLPAPTGNGARDQSLHEVVEVGLSVRS